MNTTGLKRITLGIERFCLGLLYKGPPIDMTLLQYKQVGQMRLTFAPHIIHVIDPKCQNSNDIFCS